MNAKHQLGITARLTAAMVFCAAAPTILLGVTSAIQLQDEAERGFVTSAQTLVRVVGFGFDAILQDARRTLDVVASDPEISERAADPTQHPALVKRLRRVSDRFPRFADIALLDPSGKPILSARATSPSEALQSFSPELADNHGGYVSDVYRSGPRGAPHLFMVVEIRGRDLSKRGFLAAEIDLSQLYDGLTDALGEQAAERQLLIVDSGGRAIYPPSAWSDGAVSLRDRHPAVDRVLSTLSEGHVTYADAQGREWIAVYRSMIAYNRYLGVRWGVILSQPTETAFAQATTARRQTATITLGFVLLTLLLSVPLARWLTRPLIQLAAHARAIGQQSVDTPDPSTTRLSGRADEVGALARSLSGMQTDLQRQQSQLALRHEALRRAERLSGVGLLAAGVAHEINNPLTTILGYSAFLLEDKPDDHPDRAGLDLIAAESARVREIVRGLLELSRRRHHREPLDLRDVLTRALTLAQAGLPMDGIEIALELPEAPVTVEVEGQAMLQVLMNLISNAVDALSQTPGPTLLLSCHTKEGGGAQIEVSDNGAGMSEAVQDQLFEPFFTTKASSQGTGLGMAIVRSIVDDHGGTIEVDTAIGQGARFVIALGARSPSVVQAGDV